MNVKEIRTLYDYNAWANGRVFDAASALSEDELNRDLATSHGSVKGTLTHIVAGEWIWLMRCQGTSPTALLDPADFPNLNSLRARLALVEHKRKEYLDGLLDESLPNVISYLNLAGQGWEYRLDHILQHVVNHSTYHRGQVTGMLRQLGSESVPATDFLAFFDQG
ncbi:MAG TPA: DinB family protein [Blastocatellia bacterium]|nr:DinB family protein [Blastocatellia bacterium]